VLPGQEISVSVPLYPYFQFTLFSPGEYRVTIGLVHEHVTWFKEKGDEEIALKAQICDFGPK
jgi:hypothetical protein